MEDGWFDFEDVVFFVAVNFRQCFGDDFGCGVTKLERWVVGWGAGREGVVVFLLWDCLAGFVSYVMNRSFSAFAMLVGSLCSFPS